MRKGNGITGVGVAHVDQELGGRLTLGQLQKMQVARRKDAELEGDCDKEFGSIKKLLGDNEKLNKKIEKIT